MFGNLFNQKRSDGVAADQGTVDPSGMSAAPAAPTAANLGFDPTMNVNEIAAQMRANQGQLPSSAPVASAPMPGMDQGVVAPQTPIDPGLNTAVSVGAVSAPQDPSIVPPAPVAPVDPSIQQSIVAPVVDSGIPVAPTPQPGQDSTQQPQVAGGSPLDPQNRQTFSAMSRLDPRSSQVIHQASEETKRTKQALIEPDQLLFGLIYDGEIFKLLEQFSLDAGKITQEIQTKEQMGSFSGEPTLSEASIKILEDAYGSTKNRGSSFITPEDILVALFSSAVASSYLTNQGLEKTALEQKLSKTAGFSSGKVSTLEKFGVDLTESAKNGELDPVTGRDKETERLVHILLRRTKNNPIIIGEPGVGKTAIVESLAQKIVAGQVPQDLKDRKIIQLDIAALIAGASHRGEFEERLRAVIKEVQTSEGQIVLFIDEIHTLVGAGDTEGAMDASNIVKPYLARGQLQIIGTTTSAEFRKYFQKDKAFERRFQSIVAEEPTEEVAIQMMNVIKDKYEKYHNIVFLPEAIEGAVHLSKKYIGERYLPDKAVDLIDEAAAEVKLQVNAGQRQDNQVKKSDIEKVVSAWTGIPITRLTEDESVKLLQLEDLIHKRLIDQEEAVAAVAEAVRRGRIGLAAANRPVASFLFLGPTGVGKTELAKTLAEIMFGRDDAMIRLDMSEYMEKHEVAKLIGAPPGYVGYEEGGQLTEAVRTKPYSIVLLDEVEKAHPDVFNILLQLLEDGRLTDNKGNTISFKNTIIIATSNLGSGLIQKYLLGKIAGDDTDKKDEEKKEGEDTTTAPQAAEQNTQAPNTGSEETSTPGSNGTPSQDGQQTPPVEQSSSEQSLGGIQPQGLSVSSDKTIEAPKEINFEELNKILLEELHKFFRPELLNRFDELVVFKPLSQNDMSSIAKLGIEKTSKLLKEQGLTVQISEKALAVLAKEGYDPIYGARPLRRLIQSSIENPIAIQIISKKFVNGDAIVVDYDDAQSQFIFVKSNPTATPAPTAPDVTQASVTGAPVPAESSVPGAQPVALDPSIPSAGVAPQQPGGIPVSQNPSMSPTAEISQPLPPVQPGIPQAPVTDPMTAQIPVQSIPQAPTALPDQGGIINQSPAGSSPVPDTTPPPTNGNGTTMANGETYSSTVN